MKIGIYGGSFSPPHAGHIRLAESFADRMKLDRLLIIPAGVPPHKMIDGGADGQMRYEMCKAAFLPVSPDIEVSDFEVFRTDPCYTVDTLRRFSQEGELYMLCGSDMFLSLEKWRSPEEIFRLAAVVCGTRVDSDETRDALHTAAERYRDVFGARCTVMEFEPIEISSTDVREKLRQGERPAGITDGVFEIIQRHGLYGYGKEGGNG